MSLFATDTARLSNVVLADFWGHKGWNYESLTCNETAGTTYAVGTVLGKITASGKYRISKTGAADGSQNAAAIVVEDKTLAANTDTKVRLMVRGPGELKKAGLVFDASYTTQPQKDAAYALLEAVPGVLKCID